MSKKESGEADDNHEADNGDNSDDNDDGNDNEVTHTKTEKRGPNNGVQRTVHLRLLTLFTSKGFNLSGQCPVSIGFPGIAQVLS